MGQIIGYILFTILAVLGAKWFIKKDGHPKALFYLFFAEMWERFSFYGMRALLVLYIIKDYMASIENNEEIAYGIYAAYGALVYATPLLGGFLADRFIGYRKAIMLGGVLMALGHFFMAFPIDFFFYGSLGLLIAYPLQHLMRLFFLLQLMIRLFVMEILIVLMVIYIQLAELI